MAATDVVLTREAVAVKILLLLIAAAALADAQALTGIVRSAGRPIPGAQVTVRGGGTTAASVTDADGRFELPSLSPGPTEIEVAMFGFDSLKRTITDRAQPVELNLALRAAAAPAAQSRAPAVTEETGAESPENGDSLLVQGSVSRDLERPMDFMPFMPEGSGPGGTMGAPGFGANPHPGQFPGAAIATGAQTPSAPGPGMMGGAPGGGGFGGGGGRGGMGGGGFGGPGGRPAMGPGGPGANMTPEQRARFQEMVRNRMGGPNGTFQALGNNRRRSVRDQIHGGAFFSGANSVLNATPYSVTGVPIDKPQQSVYRFGFNLGGPLQIPKMPSNQRTQFFINYTGQRGENPYTAFGIVPTQAMRSGDFSNIPTTLYDAKTNTPLPGNLIPSSQISSIAIGLLSYIPLPNSGSYQNYRLVSTLPVNNDSWNFRLNQGLPKRNRISFNGAIQTRSGENLTPFGFRDTTSGSGRNFDLQWSRSAGAHTVFNARARYNLNRNELLPYFAFQQNVSGDLGIQGNSQSPINWGPPNVNFTNFASLNDGNAQRRNLNTWTYSGGFIRTAGKHSIQSGIEFQRIQSNAISEPDPRGTIFFGGLLTSQRTETGLAVRGTGFDFADFLLGLPQQSSLRYGSVDNYLRASQVSTYLQDEWRVRPNLTLNLGVRYEIFFPYTEKYGRMANLDLAPYFLGASVVTPGTYGPYSGSIPSGMVKTDMNNIGPRTGLAWRPFKKQRTQVRLGYSIFYDGSVYSRIPTRLVSQPPFATTSSFQTSPEAVLTLSNPFTGPASTSIRNTYAVDETYPAPYAQTWNVAIEQPLPKGHVMELSYLGTKGTGLVIQRMPNRAAPGSSLTAEERRQIGNAVGFNYDSPEGNSIYEGLQVRLTRRMRQGFSWNLNYLFSKSIDNASTIGGSGNSVAQDDKNLSLERGLSAFDRRHVLNFNTLLATNWKNPWLKDWTLTASVAAQSGTPLTARVLGIAADSAGTGVGAGSGRADATGLPLDLGDGPFNRLAFIVPSGGHYGTAGRNTIPGPGSVVVNASFGRSITLQKESRYRLELRIEANNVLNHVNITSWGTVVNGADYGLASNAGAMRSVFLTARFRF